MVRQAIFTKGGGLFLTAYLKLKTNNCELLEENSHLYEKDCELSEENLVNFPKNNEKSSVKKVHFQRHLFMKIRRCFLKSIVWIKYFFHIITIKQIYQADIFIFPFQQKESEGLLKKRIYQYHMKKCIKKLKKLIQKYKINMIVLSDELKKDEFFMKEFAGKEEGKKEFTLLNGKGVFPYLIFETIEYVLKKQQKRSELTDIYLLMHDKKQIYMDNILFLIHKFKTINVVTDHLKDFQILAEKIEEKEGIPITVSNNTRKSLKNAKIIINFDYSEEELKRFSIYRRAILIQIGASLSYENQTFGGIQVYHMDIDTSKQIKDFFEKYHLLGNSPLVSLYEGILNQKENFLEVRKKIENDQVKILRLYGKNGIIDEREYQSLVL